MKGQDAVSKSELATLSGLSFPTVGRTLDLLCREGEVEQVGTGDSSGGRRAALYRLNPLFSVSLMLCVERGQIVWRAGDLEGRTVLEGEEEAAGRLMERMGEIGEEIRRRYPQLKAVVIGAAGMVSGGRIRSVGDEELGSGNVEAYFTDLFGVPVKAVNDMNAAAVGRWNRLGRRKVPASASIWERMELVQAAFWMGGSGRERMTSQENSVFFRICRKACGPWTQESGFPTLQLFSIYIGGLYRSMRLC